MKRIPLNMVLLTGLMLVQTMAGAWENAPGLHKQPHASFKTEAGDCVTSTAQFDLDINNVRARLLTGGDLWWNFSEPKYEVPKGDRNSAALTAIFAGAIWISGLDNSGNLKIAAQLYRERGDDFWPGPIHNGVVDKATCNKYDRFFSVLGANITKAQTAYLQKGTQTAIADIPKDVLAWPAFGNTYLEDGSLIGESFVINDIMAPFKDVDHDGKYNPVKGDYPIIPCRQDTSGSFADQMVFWVLNDVGNIHTETNGQQIGIQINALAFAFQTTDDVNNMTFYKYQIINKSSNPLTETYISQWVDPDLGCYANDRVGCDVNRSLGICYNGTTPDPDCVNEHGYGTQLPIVGIDFFEGPLDTGGNQLGLSSFVYFTGIGADPGVSDPQSAAQYRYYQTCHWADGTPFTQGGTGYNSGSVQTCFLFPGNPVNANEWSDATSGQAPGDRRWVQTSGPFLLKPGAPQYVTIGVVFVRPPGTGVGVPPDFGKVIGPADDKAQGLFDHCFKLPDGPDAPRLAIRELNNEILINLVNDKGSNNYGESYDATDVDAAHAVNQFLGGHGDSTFTFEGYILYQVTGPTISPSDITPPLEQGGFQYTPVSPDPAKAKVVRIVDVKDGVSSIISFIKDPALGGLFVPVYEVQSKDDGITTSFDLKDDLFATGDDKKLVNHKTYYYCAVAYAYNNYQQFDQTNPTAGGQLLPYLQGRNRFKVYSAIPHNPDPRNNGTIINSSWGEGVEVKRIEGKGNGGNALNLTPGTIEQILGSGAYAFSDTLTYVKGSDPIGLRITDPISVKEADFELRILEDSGVTIGKTSKWMLVDLTNNDTIMSDRNLDRPYEQPIQTSADNEYGFSIKLGTPVPIYTIPANYPGNGSPAKYVYDTLGSSIQFQNETERWLSFIADEGTAAVSNWIRSGTTGNNPTSNNAATKASADAFDDNWYYQGSTIPDYLNFVYDDSNQIFSNIINGTWAPYCLTSNYGKRTLLPEEILNGKPNYIYQPGFKWRTYGGLQVPPQNTLDKIASVDIIITPDKSKWSHCVVFETGEDEGTTAGNDLYPRTSNPQVTDKGALKGQIRMSYSLDWNDSNAKDFLKTNYGDTGRSWFPGYAINIETGERLNICFGESSDQPDQNGADMLWNPSDKAYSSITYPGQLISQIPYFGGKHFIYVMDSKYDEGRAAQQLLLANYDKLTPTGATQLNIPTALQPLYRSLMWTTIPYIANGYGFAADQNGVKYIPPSWIQVKLRVEKPYDRMATTATPQGKDPLPHYLFSTKGLGATEKNATVAKSALDKIRVVPNPYLAYSTYETDANTNRVKITNLPNKCTITIYSLDGTIIRTLQRAIDIDPATNTKIEISDGEPAIDVNLENTVDWDLKNEKGIAVASGIYLVHIDAPGIGQKTLKWFGAIRPADTSGF